MPRKKQGLRAYHHKSRNGCLRCKRRRVKCSMQAPACANCIRRNEPCEYAGVVNQSTAMTQWHRELETEPLHGFPGVFIDYTPQSLGLSMRRNPPSFPDNAITVDVSLGTLLRSVMGRSWFTPVEAGIWFNAIMKNIAKHPYLQHCIFSIAYLRRDLHDNPTKGGTSAAAYEHQMAASALFRQGATQVNSDNWFATLAFHVFMLVFEFGSQSACPDNQFNLIDTLRVLRSSHAIEEEAKPYFRASKLWQMVTSRARTVAMEVDSSLCTNLLALGGVIADPTLSNFGNAGVNLQALAELRRWVFSCEAHPVRWDQYCDWPGHLDPRFFDIVAQDDQVALLLVIHWAAVLYRSTKPAVFLWAKKAATYAIGRLEEREQWENLLVWPLQVLHGSKGGQMETLDKGERSKMLEVSKHMEAMSVSEDTHHNISSTFPVENWQPEPAILHNSSISMTTSSSISDPADWSSSTGSPYDTSLAVPDAAIELTWPASSTDTFYSPPDISSMMDTSFLEIHQADQMDMEASQGPPLDPTMTMGLNLMQMQSAFV